MLPAQLECHFGVYLFVALLASGLVRIVSAALGAMEYRGEKRGTFAQAFWPALSGFGAPDTEHLHNDYLFPYLIGVLEFLAYPLVLAGGHPEYIGAWLFLKTLPQWGRWKDHRPLYNRFLIANGLVILGAYGVARLCVAKV